MFTKKPCHSECSESKCSVEIVGRLLAAADGISDLDGRIFRSCFAAVFAPCGAIFCRSKISGGSNHTLIQMPWRSPGTTSQFDMQWQKIATVALLPRNDMVVVAFPNVGGVSYEKVGKSGVFL